MGKKGKLSVLLVAAKHWREKDKAIPPNNSRENEYDYSDLNDVDKSSGSSCCLDFNDDVDTKSHFKGQKKKVRENLDEARCKKHFCERKGHKKERKQNDKVILNNQGMGKKERSRNHL